MENKSFDIEKLHKYSKEEFEAYKSAVRYINYPKNNELKKYSDLKYRQKEILLRETATNEVMKYNESKNNNLNINFEKIFNDIGFNTEYSYTLKKQNLDAYLININNSKFVTINKNKDPQYQKFLLAYILSQYIYCFQIGNKNVIAIQPYEKLDYQKDKAKTLALRWTNSSID